MTIENASGYISKIQFNTGEFLDIKPNDIIIFVGPNNAGKSQSLKDIYTLSSEKSSTVVISDIGLTKRKGSLLPLLKSISNGEEHGTFTIYSVLGQNVTYQEKEADTLFINKPYYGYFRNLFIVNLDTKARLNICTPPKSINRNDAKQHPIHYAAFNGKYRKWLSENFKKAFGIEVIPNTQYGASIPLCIGTPVKLDNKYEDEQQRLEKYAAVLETYKQIQDQGDGIKSFTGILLYLMLDYYRTYLIDEPESFLHPPQARIMGEIIGQTLRDNQQAFISTHSEEIIKGLLDICPQRIKIIRITREKDKNSFSILKNDTVNKVWNDPLLKHSNIMSSLFHKSVVLCESDSDCRLYSIIDNYIKQSKGRFSETLFIHCGGKHRMAKIATALRALNIDIRLIPDIDILDNKIVFKNIVEAYGINWTDIDKDYDILISNLHSPKEKINRNDAMKEINAILNTSKNKDLSKKEIQSIRTIITTTSKWTTLKSSGKTALPAGSATLAFNKIDQILQKKGIYIVPVGELEGFVKEIGGHGPEWVNTLLERYPNFGTEIYKPIRQFIAGINL